MNSSAIFAWLSVALVALRAGRVRFSVFEAGYISWRD
jgi:hypothetical protein